MSNASVAAVLKEFGPPEAAEAAKFALTTDLFLTALISEVPVITHLSESLLLLLKHFVTKDFRC